MLEESPPVYGWPRGDEWECVITDGLTLLPSKKHRVPGWFWRKMQYLLLGFKWRRR